MTSKGRNGQVKSWVLRPYTHTHGTFKNHAFSFALIEQYSELIYFFKCRQKYLSGKVKIFFLCLLYSVHGFYLYQNVLHL